MTPQEAGAALDGALLSPPAAGDAAAGNDTSPSRPHKITCALANSRGGTGAAEGRATFRIRVVRPADEIPADSHRVETEKDAALRVSAVTADCRAFDGIDDLLGFSPPGSGGDSSLASSGGSSGGFSFTLGRDLLGDRTAGSDHPLDESWSSAADEHEEAAGAAEGVGDEVAASPQERSTGAAHHAAATTAKVGGAAETVGKAREPADREAEPAPPALSSTLGVPASIDPAGVVAGDGEVSGDGLPDARVVPPEVPSPSSLQPDQDVVQSPLQNGSVADSGYSDDEDFVDEDKDGDGSDEELTRASAAPSLISFSSASSLERDFDEGSRDDDDCKGNGDEARIRRLHKRDEMVVASAAARLRRRLLRAAKKCGGGGGGGGGGDPRIGAALLFDMLDEVKE